MRIVSLFVKFEYLFHSELSLVCIVIQKNVYENYFIIPKCPSHEFSTKCNRFHLSI